MLHKVRIFKDDKYIDEIATIELPESAHENIEVFLNAVRNALEDRGMLTVEYRDSITDLVACGAIGFICEFAGGLKSKEFSLGIPTPFRQ